MENCNFVFKSGECGYKGEASWCDQTATRCCELDNYGPTYGKDGSCKKDPLSLIKEVAVLKMEPGDILVVKIDQKISSSQFWTIKTMLRKILKDSGKENQIVVLDESADLEILKGGGQNEKERRDYRLDQGQPFGDTSEGK